MDAGRINPLRVVVKAVLFFAVFNFGFAAVDLPWQTLSVYNSLVPGRVRVPYEQDAMYYDLAHNLPVFEDFDVMFASHVISREKADDEYRVVVLGDSADWGFNLLPEQVFSERLNAKNLLTCNGKKIRLYNLAYPFPDLIKDLLILDASLAYKPDAIFWFITAMSAQDKSGSKPLIVPHAPRAWQLFEQYNLHPEVAQHLTQPSLWERTLLGRRRILKKAIVLQIYGLGWAATGLDFYLRDYEPVWKAELQKSQQAGSKQAVDPVQWDFGVLQAGYRMAGDIRVVVVNEPIFVVSNKDSLTWYNSRYSRPFYDEYRRQLQAWMDGENREYLDFWDLLPPAGFSDNPIHRSARGELLLADALAPYLLQVSCPAR